MEIFFDKIINIINILLGNPIILNICNILVILYIYLIANRKNKLEDEKLLKIISFAVILVLIYEINSLYLSGEVDNADRLTFASTFISTVGGFVGAYLIFYLTIKHDESKEKEYSKDMMFSLLEYTLEETNTVVLSIYTKFFEMTDGVKKLDCHKNLEKIIVDDLYKDLMNELKEARDIQKIKELKGLEKTIILNDKDHMYLKLQEIMYSKLNYKKIVYDEKWSNYLRHEYHDYRRYIINWINILSSKDINIPSFLFHREAVINIFKAKDINKGQSSTSNAEIYSNIELMEMFVKEYNKK